jgi:hypothetical protein
MDDRAEPRRTEGGQDERFEQSRPEAEGTAEPEEVLSLEEIAEPVAKKPLLPPSRIAFLVFVIVAAVAIVLELRAKGGYTRTVERLNQEWEKAQESAEGFYRDDLEELIHGSPWRAYDEENRTETFTWRGIRAHRLEVQYGNLDFVENYRTR